MSGEQMTAAEHFKWAQDRAVELLDQGDAGGALASIQQDLALHPGTADIWHPALRDLIYRDYIMNGPDVVWDHITTLAGPGGTAPSRYQKRERPR